MLELVPGEAGPNRRYNTGIELANFAIDAAIIIHQGQFYSEDPEIEFVCHPLSMIFDATLEGHNNAHFYSGLAFHDTNEMSEEEKKRMEKEGKVMEEDRIMTFDKMKKILPKPVVDMVWGMTYTAETYAAYVKNSGPFSFPRNINALTSQEKMMTKVDMAEIGGALSMGGKFKDYKKNLVGVERVPKPDGKSPWRHEKYTRGMAELGKARLYKQYCPEGINDYIAKNYSEEMVELGRLSAKDVLEIHNRVGEELIARGGVILI